MRAYPREMIVCALVAAALAAAVVGCASSRAAAIPGDGRTASVPSALDKADRDRAVSTALVATDASLWGAQWVGVLSGVSAMGNVALGFFSLKDIMSAYVKWYEYKMRSRKPQGSWSVSDGATDQSEHPTASAAASEGK